MHWVSSFAISAGVTSDSTFNALLKQALTQVLARRLGSGFTPALALAQAWSQMYDEIAALMLDGMTQHTEFTT
ncbi:hypothetical protein SJR62_08550 [Aeromonas caviae]|jgi:hypothetical protein|uniref:hypothetical protein n=1 Tax=Aeromonas caviae TaxID=648 RepID=UPI001F4D6E3B|nr:hypothetical protein [Aeromonas caviae]MCX4035017.1 hypothetical protein [Aeromonas caviae]MDX7769871.1 hypothetical protein [Aeromonas caviae]MDX7846317.1 hypothetical protein [Aeromonas caviae]